MQPPPESDLLTELWADVGGDPALNLADAVSQPGADIVLPSVYDVTSFATATVACATLATASLHALRTEAPLPQVRVDRRSASAAFIGERLFAPDGWARPPVWDPLAGDYRTDDGWIRLHTNYQHHRAAVVRVFDGIDDRDRLSVAIKGLSAAELEESVVAAGGCAAAMHTRQSWLATQHGSATADSPAVQLDVATGDPATAALNLSSKPSGPFAGIRVLDLTRVLAGPVCTRFLAAYGADVLRIDPRDFEEVPAIVTDVTAGKRCARLDLHDHTDRTLFAELVEQAHVLVTGLRPGALAGLGFSTSALRAINPALITAEIDAYGWIGPWATRRGFDSLVQMSCGIAAAGDPVGQTPAPLPAQALDHGTGYLAAAAVANAVRGALDGKGVSAIRCSLLGAANRLMAHPTRDGLQASPTTWTTADTEPTTTWWGPARRVPVPGHVSGIPSRLAIAAGPLGRHEPTWAR